MGSLVFRFEISDTIQDSLCIFSLWYKKRHGRSLTLLIVVLVPLLLKKINKKLPNAGCFVDSLT